MIGLGCGVLPGICLCRRGGWLGGGARDVIAVSSSEYLWDGYFDCSRLPKMVKFDLGNCARLMCVFLEAEYSNRLEWVELD